MLRVSFSVTAVVLGLLLTQGPSAAQEATKETTKDTAKHTTATAHKKRPVARHWHGYGFLPGYRPPEVIERERAERAWRNGWAYYGPAWPRFYRGRWNGGGFGPCYTQTPIGPMWNCGR
jgi:hypothetical protein